MAKKVKLEGEKPTMRVLSEISNPRVDRLLDLYKRDKRKAKILFDNDRGSGYSVSRICLFEYPNKDFRIASISKNFGMSKNAIIYSREKNIWAISYKHKTKSFYFINGNNIKQLNLSILLCQLGSDTEAYNYLLNRFGWLRNLKESQYGHSVSFNVVLRHKLFNEKNLLRHIFDCPYPVAKVLVETKVVYSPYDLVKVWKKVKEVLINIENLKPEILGSQYFFDTTRMAASLGKKVNCSWGEKRLKQEHDAFSKEITNVILEFEPLKHLNVSRVFLDFAEFSGFEVLKTNHDLIEEGKRMNHCVGTYSHNVSTGRSGIFRHGGCTLELTYSAPYVPFSEREKEGFKEEKKILSIVQYKDYSNSDAPSKLRCEVQDLVDLFNENIKNYDDFDKVLGHRAPVDDLLFPLADLPF